MPQDTRIVTEARSGSGEGRAPRGTAARPDRIQAVGPSLSPEEAGYRSMRLALDAVAEGGRDRRRVISAALRLSRALPADPVVVYRPDDHGRFAKDGR